VFDFYVPFTERSGGWSIGFLEYTGRMLEQLERHPTPRGVLPLKGKPSWCWPWTPRMNAATGLSGWKSLSSSTAGVARVICLSRMAEILIVENPDVVDEYHKLLRPIKGE